MSWLKKLFTPKADAAQKPVVGRPEPRQLRPARDMAAPEAARISGENIREWCKKLDREAERTGNRHLKRQADNIRARFRV